VQEAVAVITMVPEVQVAEVLVVPQMAHPEQRILALAEALVKPHQALVVPVL
tara:strand:- start:382 stop:537 length:156 start_codon:yes stop_codon:yes gene_type:complete